MLVYAVLLKSIVFNACVCCVLSVVIQFLFLNFLCSQMSVIVEL
jgi:hypothetical protein